MSKGDYAAFRALDPFFAVVMEGLSKFVDGEHYFDTLHDDVLFEFRYDFPGWPQVRGSFLGDIPGRPCSSLRLSRDRHIHRDRLSLARVIRHRRLGSNDIDDGYPITRTSPNAPPITARRSRGQPRSRYRA